eukprot:TRINITY_DN36045_c0_g1_i1.p1 TRINITY_DN36045_c0_g1~~TRINITY_DN36045_c0_g1_i1.p1  ORF type:complete len:1035 (+),score=112.37 TRINITY_DN36045_c0_g1_i1:116-3220(+)
MLFNTSKTIANARPPPRCQHVRSGASKQTAVSSPSRSAHFPNTCPTPSVTGVATGCLAASTSPRSRKQLATVATPAPSSAVASQSDASSPWMTQRQSRRSEPSFPWLVHQPGGGHSPSRIVSRGGVTSTGAAITGWWSRETSSVRRLSAPPRLRQANTGDHMKPRTTLRSARVSSPILANAPVALVGSNLISASATPAAMTMRCVSIDSQRSHVSPKPVSPPSKRGMVQTAAVHVSLRERSPLHAAPPAHVALQQASLQFLHSQRLLRSSPRSPPTTPQAQRQHASSNSPELHAALEQHRCAWCAGGTSARPPVLSQAQWSETLRRSLPVTRGVAAEPVNDHLRQMAAEVSRLRWNCQQPSLLQATDRKECCERADDRGCSGLDTSVRTHNAAEDAGPVAAFVAPISTPSHPSPQVGRNTAVAVANSSPHSPPLRGDTTTSLSTRSIVSRVAFTQRGDTSSDIARVVDAATATRHASSSRIAVASATEAHGDGVCSNVSGSLVADLPLHADGIELRGIATVSTPRVAPSSVPSFVSSPMTVFPESPSRAGNLCLPSFALEGGGALDGDAFETPWHCWRERTLSSVTASPASRLTSPSRNHAASPARVSFGVTAHVPSSAISSLASSRDRTPPAGGARDRLASSVTASPPSTPALPPLGAPPPLVVSSDELRVVPSATPSELSADASAVPAPLSGVYQPTTVAAAQTVALEPVGAPPMGRRLLSDRSCGTLPMSASTPHINQRSFSASVPSTPASHKILARTVTKGTQPLKQAVTHQTPSTAASRSSSPPQVILSPQSQQPRSPSGSPHWTPQSCRVSHQMCRGGDTCGKVRLSEKQSSQPSLAAQPFSSQLVVASRHRTPPKTCCRAPVSNGTQRSARKSLPARLQPKCVSMSDVARDVSHVDAYSATPKMEAPIAVLAEAGSGSELVGELNEDVPAEHHSQEDRRDHSHDAVFTAASPVAGALGASVVQPRPSNAQTALKRTSLLDAYIPASDILSAVRVREQLAESRIVSFPVGSVRKSLLAAATKPRRSSR